MLSSRTEASKRAVVARRHHTQRCRIWKPLLEQQGVVVVEWYGMGRVRLGVILGRVEGGKGGRLEELSMISACDDTLTSFVSLTIAITCL